MIQNNNAIANFRKTRTPPQLGFQKSAQTTRFAWLNTLLDEVRTADLLTDKLPNLKMSISHCILSMTIILIFNFFLIVLIILLCIDFPLTLRVLLGDTVNTLCIFLNKYMNSGVMNFFTLCRFFIACARIQLVHLRFSECTT